MQPKLLLCLFASLFSLSAFAQGPKPAFALETNAGISAGESGAGFHGEVVGGLKFNAWRIGVGVGYDEYHTAGIPVFAAVRKSLSAKPQAAFLYLDAGYHSPLNKGADKFTVRDQTGGFYGEGGIGYAVPAFKNRQFFFGAGWRIKTFSSTVNTLPYLSVWPPPAQAWSEYRYRLSTVALKTGLRF